MEFSYRANQETNAEVVDVYNTPAYKVDESRGILPAMFTELRIQADKELSDGEIDNLYDLVAHLWRGMVDGCELTDIWCDGKDAFSTNANLYTVDADPWESFGRGRRFVAELPAFVKRGTGDIPAMDINVSIWVNEVQIDNSVFFPKA